MCIQKREEWGTHGRPAASLRLKLVVGQGTRLPASAPQAALLLLSHPLCPLGALRCPFASVAQCSAFGF